MSKRTQKCRIELIPQQSINDAYSYLLTLWDIEKYCKKLEGIEGIDVGVDLPANMTLPKDAGKYRGGVIAITPIASKESENLLYYALIGITEIVKRKHPLSINEIYVTKK